jgi:hypothetical protein
LIVDKPGDQLMVIACHLDFGMLSQATFDRSSNKNPPEAEGKVDLI